LARPVMRENAMQAMWLMVFVAPLPEAFMY
jgi:hypothetical protein